MDTSFKVGLHSLSLYVLFVAAAIIVDDQGMLVAGLCPTQTIDLLLNMVLVHRNEELVNLRLMIIAECAEIRKKILEFILYSLHL